MSVAVGSGRELAAAESVRRRRQVTAAVLATLSGAFAWSGAAAQGRTDVRTVRIGMLSTSSRSGPGTRAYLDILFAELARSGWTEGRNLAVDLRFADGILERHDTLARELVALKPDLIIASTQPGAVAVMKATSTIPIVFVQAPDPVGGGLADSLAHPGRNATGLSSLNSELVPKRLELMREILPKCRRVAVMHQPNFSIADQQLALVEQAARSLGLDVVRVPVDAPQAFDAAFAEVVRARPDGVLVIESPSLYTHRGDLVRRMADARLPAMYGLQDFALAGGLVSYSISFDDQFRRAAGYVARVLRGEKPANMPIERPLKFELTVNRKAAHALGLDLPPAVLLRVDRLVE